MTNLSSRDMRRRNRRAVALAVLGLTAAGVMLALVLGRTPGPPPPPTCKPQSLAVVAGDTAATDAAYVLDTCGRVRRQKVER